MHKCWFRSLARSFGSIKIFCLFVVVVVVVLVVTETVAVLVVGVLYFVFVLVVVLDSDRAVVVVDVNTDSGTNAITVILIITKHITWFIMLLRSLVWRWGRRRRWTITSCWHRIRYRQRRDDSDGDDVRVLANVNCSVIIIYCSEWVSDVSYIQ